MGLEVETMCYAPEEVMQTANQDYDWSLDMPATRAKTTSLGGLPKSNKKRMMTTTNSTMRKSLSDKPLVATNSSTCLTTPNPVIASSASLESGLGESNQVSLDADIPASGSSTIASGRRQQLLERADEILNGKTHVGMQLGETCPVCLTDDVDTQLTGCGHRVHAKCIKRWIYQSGAKCPVCREVVSGVQEAYSGPPSGIFHHALEKDLAPDVAAYSDDATTSTDDNQANEWGWFEEFDDTMDEDELLPHLHNQRRRHSVPSAHSPVLNREMSTTFEVCRTFPPLRPEYDTLYADSKHSCLHTLPSHRHIAAKIQIRSFRIVETKSKTQHAEYLIEVQLDGKYISKWRRFSELCRFVGTLGTNQFHRTLAAWAELEAASRWFNRLEVAYLHRRCRMLEEFAHALLLESSSAHPLAGLLEG